MDADEMFESLLQEVIRKTEMTIRQERIISDLRKENGDLATRVVDLDGALRDARSDYEKLQAQLVATKAEDIKLNERL